MDCNASVKAAQFIQFCDGFNIPIISFVDVPGFLPGINQERQGIIRHGSKMLFAYANAATIKITILLRKAYGGAYIAMCSKHLGADSVYSWPHAEIAVLGAESAVSIIHRKELSKLPENERTEKRQIYINEYKEKYMNSMLAMKEGYIDEEIQPNETRNILINDLNSFADKKSYIILNKKHGNITL